MQTARAHWLFFVAACVFGVVSVAAGSSFLWNEEIAVRQGRGKRDPVVAEQAVVGRIRPDDALFYPIAIGWIAIGATILVAAPAALITGSHVFGLIATLATVGVLVMGFSTVGAAYWYGNDPLPAKESAPAVAPADPAAPQGD